MAQVQGSARVAARKEFVRIVENEILPVLGRLKEDEVKKGDIRAMVDKIADRAPTMGRRVRGVLRLLYSWAVEHDRVAAMPAFPKPVGEENRRSRVLSEDEMRRAWDAMGAEDGILGAAFRLMLLTGQRRGEVLQMRWRDLAEETGRAAGWWWTIPAEFAKNGRTHRVPLAPQAREIVDRLRPISGEGEWVFPSPHEGKGPILNPQKAAERLWKRARIEDATLHDLRRTYGTFVSGLFGASGRFVVKLRSTTDTATTSRSGRLWKSGPIIYRVDADAIVIAEVFTKKTAATPASILESCRRRLKEYDNA
jgi:integrase